MASVIIAGVGSYAPARVLTNQELSKMVDTSDEWIVTRSGIRERRIAAPDEACSENAEPSVEPSSPKVPAVNVPAANSESFHAASVTAAPTPRTTPPARSALIIRERRRRTSLSVAASSTASM